MLNSLPFFRQTLFVKVKMAQNTIWRIFYLCSKIQHCKPARKNNFKEEDKIITRDTLVYATSADHFLVLRWNHLILTSTGKGFINELFIKRSDTSQYTYIQYQYWTLKTDLHLCRLPRRRPAKKTRRLTSCSSRAAAAVAAAAHRNLDLQQLLAPSRPLPRPHSVTTKKI